jgi:predicted alpha-1,6-mannanase (GH76 family)
VVAILAATFAWQFVAAGAAPPFAAEAEASFLAFKKSFFVLTNGAGYFKKTTEGGRADFWTQAEEIEIVVDAFERSRQPREREMIAQTMDGFIKFNGSNWLSNPYNDDILWMVIASARSYRATGDATYKQLAKLNFDQVYDRAADGALGGGLWWTTKRQQKNACVNGPGAIAACLLCELYRDRSYVKKAETIYAWERQNLFRTNSGAVCDNIKADGTVNQRCFTYNTGTFIGAANYLKKLTGTQSYVQDATAAAVYAREHSCFHGIFPEYGTRGDSGGFNGIFARWMVAFVRDNGLEKQFQPWLAQNAEAALKVRRDDGLSWGKWRTPTPDVALPSWSCSSSVVLLQVMAQSSL